MNKSIFAAVLAVPFFGAGPVLAQSMVIGAPTVQIQTEKQFSDQYNFASIAANAALEKLLGAGAAIGAKEGWRNPAAMGRPPAGTLTVVSRSSDCAVIRHDVPGLGAWNIKACRLPTGQYAID